MTWSFLVQQYLWYSVPQQNTSCGVEFTLNSLQALSSYGFLMRYLTLVRGRAVEAGVPLAHGILVPGAVLAAQNWKGR